MDYELYKDNIESYTEDTCQWFLISEKYKSWLNESYGVLTLVGDSGSGKSVVAKYLVDVASSRSTIICQFFFQCQGKNSISQALGAVGG